MISLATISGVSSSRNRISSQLFAKGSTLVRHVRGALLTARALLGKSEPRFNSLQSQHEGLLINQELLDEAENIEDFHARLGGHSKASQDRPHLEAQRQQLLTGAEYIVGKKYGLILIWPM